MISHYIFLNDYKNFISGKILINQTVGERLFNKVCLWLWQKYGIHRNIFRVKLWLATVWEHSVEWWESSAGEFVNRRKYHNSVADNPDHYVEKGQSKGNSLVWYRILHRCWTFHFEGHNKCCMKCYEIVCGQPTLSGKASRHFISCKMGHPMLQMMRAGRCTIISQDDGLGWRPWIGLLAAHTWRLVTFSCGNWPRNKFIAWNQETWKNWG
jgi:hypothetical protein